MGRKPGSKNKPKDNGASEAQEHADAGPDPTETIAAQTLRGDIRDRILAEFKGMPKPWQQMSEAEQERVIHLAADIAQVVVNRAVLIAAAEGAPYLSVEVAEFTVKDGIKAKITTPATIENITHLAEHSGLAVLVLVNPAQFKGQRAPAQPDVVGELRMPRAPAGVHGDELPDEHGLTATEVVNRAAADAGSNIIDVTPTDSRDPGPIPPSLRRLPPPSDDNRPDTSQRPFNDFDEGPRHV